VIRSEILQALQSSQLSADVDIAANVMLLLERPSTRFGAPSSVRTYSVELTGNSRGAALALPPKHSFEFDSLDRSALQAHARQLASATVEAVRAAKGKN